MGIGQDLSKLSKEEVKEVAEEKDLIPSIVEGTDDVIQFANKSTDGVKETDWKTFFQILDEKNLTIYSTKEGWMKIMKDEEK